MIVKGLMMNKRVLAKNRRAHYYDRRHSFVQQIILRVSSLQTSHISHEKGISGLAYQSTLAIQSVVIKHIMENNSVNTLTSILE